MVESATGTGAAFNASVSTAELEEALKLARARDEAAQPALRVERAKDKLARAQRDLGQAEGELAAALAALEN